MLEIQFVKCFDKRKQENQCCRASQNEQICLVAAHIKAIFHFSKAYFQENF